MTIQTLSRTTTLAQLLSFLLLCASPIPAFSQPAAPAAEEPPAPTFEVVSIRPHKDNGNYSHWWHPTPVGYEAYSAWPQELIFAAYELKYPGQLIDLPQWTREETFDIEARMNEADAAAIQKLAGQEQFRFVAPMIRSMLADRFQLKVHSETRILPVYELVVAKSGFKLKQAQEPENLLGMSTNRGLIHVPRSRIGTRFIVGLSNAAGRTVIDKTGLTGYYDIDLKWTPDEDLAAGAIGPTLFTALEEQLGLKLVPAKAPVDVLVVDHIDQPSAN